MCSTTQRNKKAKKEYVTAKHNVTLWMMTQRVRQKGEKGENMKQKEDSIQKEKLVATIKEMLISEMLIYMSG